MDDHLVFLKPPKSPNFGGLVLMQSLMGETPCSLAASLESFVPPRIGGLGGRNHTQNQQRQMIGS
ncbi:hypothetical protein BJP37_28675 [Moorena bouillonii PNG]|uniref:Uncharacterized protein n=1 Tax=Moorena bouillonii PNG TaxID=568701 RepID=A0A1U7N8Y1_9CYAN|nr:hypothetical protein BJP37_28675 [Moorena bouillonii PNG]